ncbi:hypothetical protein BHE74_00003360 [Ensete ventricosum]|nr:hypothetical protein GW17_00043425 [Ensete ventricosum]RWW87786.1 hypothetical protein BHE74_00003360 [Ensete ventricosum]
MLWTSAARLRFEPELREGAGFTGSSSNASYKPQQGINYPQPNRSSGTRSKQEHCKPPRSPSRESQDPGPETSCSHPHQQREWGGKKRMASARRHKSRMRRSRRSSPDLLGRKGRRSCHDHPYHSLDGSTKFK